MGTLTWLFCPAFRACHNLDERNSVMTGFGETQNGKTNFKFPVQSRGLLAWLWLLESEAKPKPTPGHDIWLGLAWLVHLWLGLAFGVTRGLRVMREQLFHWVS